MADKPTYEALEQRVKELEKNEAQLKLMGEKLVEDEQRVSNQLDELDHLFSKTPVGLCLMDTDLRFVRINEKLAGINGKPASEHIGRTLGEVIPEIAKQVEPIYHRVIQSGEPELDFEVHGTTEAEPNIIKYWLVSYYPIKSVDGKVTGINTVVQDITERKMVEMTLKKNEERFRNFLENLNDAAYEADCYGNITYANNISEKITGLPLKDIIGKPFLPLFNEESRKIATDVYQRTLNGESPEYDLTFINGTICHFKNEPLRDKDGKIIGVYGIARDVTKHKQAEEALMVSEERYRSLAENSMVGFWEITLEGYTTYINPAMCSMIEIEGPEALSGQTYHSFFTRRSLETIDRERDKRLEGKGSCYEAEIVGKRGGRCNVMICGASLLSAEDKLQGYIATFTDITARKRAEKALQKAHDELESKVAERTRELKIQKSNLEEANIALQVLLDKRLEDKKEIQANVLTNVKELVVPYFEKIKKTNLNEQQKAFLSIVETNLNEIISPFTRKMSLKYLNLTPTEIHVANLIRHGTNSKEIAEIMNLSTRTIYNHRKNIRKKLGLESKKTNLRSHLLSTY